MLTYSALATLYLAYLGIRGEWVGTLLWPAVAAHAVLTILLARAWCKAQKAVIPKRDTTLETNLTAGNKTRGQESVVRSLLPASTASFACLAWFAFNSPGPLSMILGPSLCFILSKNSGFRFCPSTPRRAIAKRRWINSQRPPRCGHLPAPGSRIGWASRSQGGISSEGSIL